MSTEAFPGANLDELTNLRVSYDAEFDIAMFHVGEPRPAVTSDGTDGWWIRVADGVVVGVEIHGFKQLTLARPDLASLLAPALREARAVTERSMTEDWEVAGSTDQFPALARAVVAVVAIALERLEQVRREDAAAALRA